MQLAKMISGGLTCIREIGEYLDTLSHDDRMREIYALSAVDMKGLYVRAEDAEAIEVVHFIPEEHPDRTQMIHRGFNSLPAFRKFQKRFCRSRDMKGKTAYFGYNEGITRPLVGPGFFVLHSTEGVAKWEDRGALVIDYHLTPDGPVADGWPKVIPNTVGLQQMVYDKTRDFMRKVSNHVSIGAAYKWEQPIGAYFILCRES